MKIGFIRHGQTNWNAQDFLQGSTDIPLNDVGRQQARDAVARLRERQGGLEGLRAVIRTGQYLGKVDRDSALLQPPSGRKLART